MVLEWSVILAVLALALLWITRYSSLIAFTIVFLTLGGLALAAFKVLALVLDNFVFESFNIPFQDILNGFPSFVRVLDIIMTLRPRCIFALAIGSASRLISEAFTIQFKTFRTLTFAAHAVDSGLLVLDLSEELLLRDGLVYYLLRHLPYVLFVFLILDLLLLV